MGHRECAEDCGPREGLPTVGPSGSAPTPAIGEALTTLWPWRGIPTAGPGLAGPRRETKACAPGPGSVSPPLPGEVGNDRSRRRVPVSGLRGTHGHTAFVCQVSCPARGTQRVPVGTGRPHPGAHQWGGRPSASAVGVPPGGVRAGESGLRHASLGCGRSRARWCPRRAPANRHATHAHYHDGHAVRRRASCARSATRARRRAWSTVARLAPRPSMVAQGPRGARVKGARGAAPPVRIALLV